MGKQTFIKPTYHFTGRTALVFGLAISLLLSIFTLVSSIQTTHAITPPDNCFNFNSGTGTITDYYEHQANDSSNPVCPRAVDIPATIGGVSVATIDDYAFVGNHKLTQITIPNSVTTIGNYAFSSNKFTSVTIPSSVTTIGNNAFYQNQLTSVVFEGPVTTFGDDVFYLNPITSITYDGTEYTPQLPIDDACFEMSGNTLTKYLLFDMNLIKDNGIGCVSSQVDIPATVSGTPVTAIGNNAFYQNQLTSVTIPSSVTAIGDYAFYTTQLTQVTIPSSVTAIGSYTFSGNQLTSVVFEGPVTTFGNNIFYMNPITSITYDGTEYVQQLPIDDACFEMWGSTLTAYLLFDMNLIKDNGIGCISREVDIPATIDGTPVTAIGGGAFSDLLITHVTIPGSVSTIDDGAFRYNLLTSLTLGSGVETIGEDAFYANKLTTVHIPSSVTSIGNTAFAVQNPYGGYIEWEYFYYPDYYIWSYDPQIVQNTYDVIWYAQLYTEDPSNPAGLHDGIMNEAWWWGMDANDNGHQNDSLGGHLINTATVTINFTDSYGNQVQPSQTLTGMLPDDTPLVNYLVTQGPAMPVIDDPTNLTPEEQADLDEALSAYYRIGDTFTYTAPILQDIIPIPASYSFMIHSNTEDNTITFTYSGLSSSDDPEDNGELAETGIATFALGTLSALIISYGAVRIHVQRTKRYAHQSRM